ncbi:MAG TPA: hypothetical protein VGG39_35160 [Polyangiaceae bacterium]|jgi:DNA-directed RNA polymerase specialized sigma24 family protein
MNDAAHLSTEAILLPAQPDSEPSERSGVSEVRPPEPPAMSMDDKARFLAERRTLAAIRTVAGRRGVRRQHREDVVQQTCIRAWKTRLPADPKEARPVLNRIAALVSAEVTRPSLLGVPVPIDDVHDAELSVQASDPAYDAEVRDQLGRLFEKARERFPQRFDAFLAAAVGNYPSQVEANERGVTDAQVRKERSDVRRFLEQHGQKMGLVVAAALVLLVFGSMRDWTRSSHIERDGDWSSWSPPRHDFRPAADASSLRVLAAQRYSAAEYEACLRDLDAAKAIDGRADTEDEAHMRATSEHELRTEDAKYPMPIK